jgi:hypothetical protein
METGAQDPETTGDNPPLPGLVPVPTIYRRVDMRLAGLVKGSHQQGAKPK